MRAWRYGVSALTDETISKRVPSRTTMFARPSGSRTTDSICARHPIAPFQAVGSGAPASTQTTPNARRSARTSLSIWRYRSSKRWSGARASGNRTRGNGKSALVRSVSLTVQAYRATSPETSVEADPLVVRNAPIHLGGRASYRWSAAGARLVIAIGDGARVFHSLHGVEQRTEFEWFLEHEAMRRLDEAGHFLGDEVAGRKDEP